MIILTGGGGMIGSMIAWHLNTQMNFDDFVIVDDLINEQQDKFFLWTCSSKYLLL